MNFQCESNEANQNKEFLNAYKRNKLYFPPLFCTSDSNMCCSKLIIRSITALEPPPPSANEQLLRIRATYFLSSKNSFLGKTYISELKACNTKKHTMEISEPLLLTYISAECLNVIIEISIQYRNIQEDTSIGYIVVDLSNPTNSKAQLICTSPSQLLLRGNKPSIYITRPNIS